MDIALRVAREDDISFARELYFQTMRWMIERLFGWDQTREEESFARYFRLEEAAIIIAGDRNAGWLQTRSNDDAIHLLQLYVTPALQRKGIGTQVLQGLLAQARSAGKAVTLAVVKINPALRFYEKHGFQITHEDEYKFYMRLVPSRGSEVDSTSQTR